MKTPTPDRVKRVISAVVASPNRSVGRAALWTRLHKLLEKLRQ